MARGEIADRRHRDQRNLGRSQRFDIMIGPPQDRIVQIDDIALHVDREDLPPAIAGQLVADRIAFQQQAGMGRLVILAGDELAGRHGFEGERKRQYRGLVGGVERQPELQLPEHRHEGRKIFQVTLRF